MQNVQKPVQIRPLNAEDAVAYRTLRLRALHEHPESFATSVEEEQMRSDTEVAQRLIPRKGQLSLGVLLDDDLKGYVTLVLPEKTKLRHRAIITSMYVVPEVRGQKFAKALLERAISVAGEWAASEVALGVTVGNHAARRLYASAGFVTYGIEPRCIQVGGNFYDVEWMNLQLK